MSDPGWSLTHAESPLIATAIHNGHDMRPNMAMRMVLPRPDRLREEDPYTGEWTDLGGARVVALRSRFEVDLNRPRERAVYRKPEDAWGLEMWSEEPTAELVQESLAHYDAFYEEMRRVLKAAEQRHGSFVLFDIHSYNHRRSGPGGQAADPDSNPEVNVGTGTMPRELWAPVVDQFIHALREFDFGGRRLDVRENIKFRGGQLSRWTHRNFPESGCALAIEFKKFFMDEWTGEVDSEQHRLVLEALRSTVPAVLEQLQKLSAV
jgi:N-formylglutamate deformylase